MRRADPGRGGGGDLGVGVNAAFGNEFVLLRRGTNGLEPVDSSPDATTTTLDAPAEHVTDLADALTAQGLSIEHVHAREVTELSSCTDRTGWLSGCDPRV